MDALSTLRTALAGVASRPELADVAARNLYRWMTDPGFAEYRPLLARLVSDERWDLLLDSFYRVIPFGTGGRRGPVGVGTNRMNPYTLATSVQGHVAFLRERYGEGADLAVVLAADVRIFRDLRETYPPDVPNPLLGLTSRDLAALAGEVYAAAGVTVHTYPLDGDRFMATPELSFAIRQLGAHGGLNVSASHNHPDDNGGKFYNAQGGQEIPPQDERMADLVERVTEVRRMPFADAVRAGKVRFLGEEIHEGYIALNLSLSLLPQARGAKVVFTNLHGVGDGTVGELLERAGFSVRYTEAQRPHDGLFPGVAFRAPNPEIPEAFGPARRIALDEGADVVLATDPDADRIGALVPDGRGGMRFLTGNELSCLVCAYVYETPRPPGTVAVKTEVTTELFTRIAEAAGARVVGHLLVGCKYIAEEIRKLEAEGRIDAFVMGTEESHGFLLTPLIRDKDGAAPALMLAELASLLAGEGRTVLDYLSGIYRRFGYHHTLQVPLVMRGAVGRARIEAIQAAFRARPPVSIAGRAVTAFHDRQDPRGVFGPIQSETDRASRDVLVFELEGGARAIVRPSGTEPKTKIYIEVPSEPLGEEAGEEALARQVDACARAAEEIGRDFTRAALAAVGLSMPDFAYRISGLMAIDDRIDLAESVLPELRARVEAGEGGQTLQEWLDGRMKGYGKDARALVKDGFQGWVEALRPGDPALAARLEAVFLGH